MTGLRHLFRHLSSAAKRDMSWQVYSQAAASEYKTLKEELAEKLSSLESEYHEIRQSHPDRERLTKIQEQILRLKQEIIRN